MNIDELREHIRLLAEPIDFEGLRDVIRKSVLFSEPSQRFAQCKFIVAVCRRFKIHNLPR